jgi:hypothetical protein
MVCDGMHFLLAHCVNTQLALRGAWNLETVLSMLLVGGWLLWPGEYSWSRLTALMLGRLLGVLLFTEARLMGCVVQWSPMKPESWVDLAGSHLSLRQPAPIAGYIVTYRTCRTNTRTAMLEMHVLTGCRHLADWLVFRLYCYWSLEVSPI